MISLAKLEKVIKKSLGRDTCYYKRIWDDKNQTDSAGHCRVVALIVNDYLKGKILFAHVKNNKNYTHYWNKLPDGKEVDLTKDQFNKNIKLTKPIIIPREKALDNKIIQRTYVILKKKVAKNL